MCSQNDDTSTLDVVTLSFDATSESASYEFHGSVAIVWGLDKNGIIRSAFCEPRMLADAIAASKELGEAIDLAVPRWALR